MESEEAGKQEGWEVRKGLRNSGIEELGDGIEEESEIGEEAGKPEKAHPGEIRSAVVNEFHEAGSSKIKADPQISQITQMEEKSGAAGGDEKIRAKKYDNITLWG